MNKTTTARRSRRPSRPVHGLNLLCLLLSIGATSCVDPAATICPTGIMCPSGARCALHQPACILDGCGDGVVEGEEQCDDGNLVSGDGCSAQCKLEGCGNGIVDIALGERCDDGNTEDGDGCSADCRTNERCGNGILDADLGEVCDDGNNASGDGCSADCLSEEVCGNGYLDLVKGEECEPSLPIPSGLMGITCSEACRYLYAEGVQPLAAQCRLTLEIVEGTADHFYYDEEAGESVFLEDVQLTFPGRIVSNKGGIDCVPGSATCTSALIPCGEAVLLMYLPNGDDETAYYEAMRLLDWNVPGCTAYGRLIPDGAESAPAGDLEQTNAFLWCAVTLDAQTPDVALTIDYDEKACERDADCDDFHDCTVDTCDLATNECVHTPVDCCEPGAGWNGYGCSAPISSVEIPAGSYERLGAILNFDAFRLATAPITVAEFEACLGAGACAEANFQSHSAEDASRALCNYGRGSIWQEHPMNCVNWYGANEFCAWIGGRLPRLEEWEYAALHDGETARGADYPWGGSIPGHCIHANYYSSVAGPNVYCDGLQESSAAVGTSAVGTYAPTGNTALGLQDMLGNVFEWTQTPYGQEADIYQQVGGSHATNALPLVELSRAAPTDSVESGSGFRCALGPHTSKAAARRRTASSVMSAEQSGCLSEQRKNSAMVSSERRKAWATLE